MWMRTLLTALACSVAVAVLATTSHAAPSVRVPDAPEVAAARAAIATCPGAGAAPVTAVPAPASGCDPTGPIVALGDSVTYGYGVTMTAFSTPPAGAWPAVLHQLVGIPVVNAGVNGDTADTVLHPSTPGFGHRPAALQVPALLALHPRLVIVGFGMAEAVYGIPIARAAADLDTLLRTLGDVPTVIVGSHVDCSEIRICRGGDGVRYTSAWDDELRIIAARHHSGLVLDVQSGLAADGGMTDTLHPNLHGYQVMASRMAPVVRDRLAAASRGWLSGGRLLHS
jgi:lysophospholipase L1-like esterase